MVAITSADRCASCGAPFALVGRVHRCVPRRVPAPVADPVTHEAPAQETDSQAKAAALVEDVIADIGRRYAECGAQDEIIRQAVITGTAAVEITPNAIIDVDLASGEDKTAIFKIERTPNGVLNVVSISEQRAKRQPKRDRAAYMRGYRARKKAERQTGAGA